MAEYDKEMTEEEYNKFNAELDKDFKEKKCHNVLTQKQINALLESVRSIKDEIIFRPEDMF